jgi:hypothetical protein
MAFTFTSPTLSGHIDEYEVILFDMVRQLGLDLPLLADLEKAFYESPRIERNKVAALRNEALRAIRGFIASSSAGSSAFDRALKAQTPYFREIAKDLKPWDPERCLASLVAVCDDALEHDAGITCLSD